MIDLGKKSVLGIKVNAIDYEAAIAKIIASAKAGKAMAISALAVHGVMTGVQDSEHRFRLNNFHLIVPDGQPVRWALNLLHKAGLKDRVYGPTLTLKLCEQAAKEDVPIFLYGSKPDVLEQFSINLREKFPGLRIVGQQASLFRQTTPEEKQEVIQKIKESGAEITFVGLGCPRQEVWAYEYHQELSMPVLSVGAAFDFHAGTLAQAPSMLQDWGLEWAFRLAMEPKRLWKRYLYLNPLYMWNIFLQASKLKHFDPEDSTSPREEILYG